MDKPYRYDEDITGLNPDNLVSGEEILLSNRDIRVAKFRYGPVFLESVRLFDAATMQPLVEGEHYRIPWISHELSLRTAKEIVHSVLITDRTVGDRLIASYQALGGSSMPLSQEIMTAYEILLNDNRSVDWTTGVFGKPNAYPPSAHPTFFNDIYGWQALGFQLERLTQAIALGNTPAFDQIIKAYQTFAASKLQMETGEDMKRLVSIEGLLHVADKYNFNTMTMIPETYVVTDGRGFWVDVTSRLAKPGYVYYWSIAHETTTPEDFVTRTGVVTLNHGAGRFYVQTSKDVPKEENEYFYVTLHLNNPEGVEVIRTEKIMLRRHSERGAVTGALIYGSDCMLHYPIANNAMAHAIVPRLRAMRRSQY